MVSQITKGIKISVLTAFEGTYFKNHKIHYAFSYMITIENQGNDSVQLITRHWEILDSLNYTETVDGEGVIGKKPVLKSGESYTYSSGCLLCSPFGSIRGAFQMVSSSTTKNFAVVVPTSRMNAPFALN